MLMSQRNNLPKETITKYTKINNKSPVICSVRHTISVADPVIMTFDRIIRISIIVLLFIITLIGSIYTCITSSKISPFIPVAPDGSINGEWCPWSPWSKCSITCSNNETPYGTIVRRRYCNSPPPQQGGKNCSGESLESETCFNEPCPIPTDGNWSEWTEWSVCSKTCKEDQKAPLQIRSRLCNEPAPQNGGKQCVGEPDNQRFCEWLPQCPVDGQWGNWYIAGPCESTDKIACALGRQRHQRQCNNPSPTGTGNTCEGMREKLEDCWFYIGCPVDLQPPLNILVVGNNTGLFNVSWSSVPYGKTAVLYRIYKTIEDQSNKQLDTFYEEVIAVPQRKVTSQNYWKIVDMRKYNSTENFKTLAIRMSSIDYWQEESALTKPVRSKVSSVDGEWSEWGHWTDCSVKCSNQKGERIRTRNCDDPSPSKGGKPCNGSGEEKRSCIGMEDACI